MLITCVVFYSRSSYLCTLYLRFSWPHYLGLMKIFTCVIKFGTLVPTYVERRKLLVFVRYVDVFYLRYFDDLYLCFSTNYTCVGFILVIHLFKLCWLLVLYFTHVHLTCVLSTYVSRDHTTWVWWKFLLVLLNLVH